jgi:isoleucyl-tRNA synthetase
VEKKDYKDTLNMPETNFEMRANLNEKEGVFRKE